MMTTIAIVGAGPGVGAAIARRFGAEGFHIQPGHPTHDPAVLADLLWQAHEGRERFIELGMADPPLLFENGPYTADTR
jgi:NAD(P)-dependent dehydrogenase (short-subunit alcohol dehydrogenase family)